MNRIERFWEKVDRSGECWLWIGAVRSPGGYGAFWDGTRVVRSHRYIYEAEVGGIAEGLVIDHVCRNRMCVRPEHLRAVTQKQNSENRGDASASASGIRGVHWDKRRGRWLAHLTHNYKFHFLGYFDTRADAAVAASAARSQIFTHSGKTELGEATS